MTGSLEARSATTAWVGSFAFEPPILLHISSADGINRQSAPPPMTAIRRAERNNEWWVDFQWRGRRIRKRSPIQNKRGAEMLEQSLRREFSEADFRGMDPFASRPPKFADFCAEWYEKYVLARNRPYTQREKQAALKHHLVPAFGPLHLDEITTERIDEFTASKARAGYAPKSINNFLTILRCCLVTANEWRRLAVVPRVRWVRVPEQPYKSLTEEQLERVIAAADPGFWHTLILFVADTGVRFHEAAALHWQDVDLASITPSAHICRGAAMGIIGPTKTGRSRIVPLTARVQRALRDLPRSNDLVFPRRDGKPMRTEHSIDGLYRACDRVGVPRVGWHALRHTIATLLSQRGVPLGNVQKLLGHSTITMTSRYAHSTVADLRQWMARCWRPTDSTFGHLIVTNEILPPKSEALDVMKESQPSRKPALCAGPSVGGP